MNIERVMTEYQSALRAFLLSRVGTSADSDDLVQEVLIKTFQNLHTLEDPAKLKPWLFRIAQNVLMDHYRRKARGAGLTAEDLWHAEDSEEAHAFEGCVEPFLKVLPDEAAALLRAVDLDGRPQKDYAAQLGI
ncbi:MAG: sigma-70 family RNA polymerase sigma factor, partial [Pseudomonadota bacterium]